MNEQYQILRNLEYSVEKEEKEFDNYLLKVFKQEQIEILYRYQILEGKY